MNISLSQDQRQQFLGFLFSAVGAFALYSCWSDFKKGRTTIPRTSFKIRRDRHPIWFWSALLLQVVIYTFLVWAGLSYLLIASGVPADWPLMPSQ